VSAVRHPVTALGLGDDGEIEGKTLAILVYDPADPWAVSLHFPHSAQGYVAWTVARCVLSQGIVQTTGDGDLRVTPADGMVRIELSSPDGHVALVFDADEIEEFLNASFALVPEGTEHRHVDLDRLVRELLGGVR